VAKLLREHALLAKASGQLPGKDVEFSCSEESRFRSRIYLYLTVIARHSLNATRSSPQKAAEISYTQSQNASEKSTN
jgi:hypothetical protein